MCDFKLQIENDIIIIQRDYGYIDDRLVDKEYAFNYWILNRIFSLDEEVIPSNITESNDKNIDCFVHYEDLKELYIIQNKYYSDTTAVNREDVSDFLKTPLSVLSKDRYTRSPELQKIFNRIHDDSEYKIWLHFYVTNNKYSEDINDLFEDFSFTDNNIDAFVGARYYNLDDIKKLYFEDRFSNKVSFNTIIPTHAAGTSLDVRAKEYGMPWMIDLRYVMVNVAYLYHTYKMACEKNYELFEENIREYLGTQGINNGIIRTLKNPKDRENFFYYNNGITIICESCKTLRANDIPQVYKKHHPFQYGFELQNPQIVNGCQTINSIAEVLSHYSEDRLYTEFSKTFVLVKIFVFDEVTKSQKAGLDKNIVRFTNSQNGLTDKAFASKKDYFLNIQKEFEKRGYLLLVKPSDKNKYNQLYADKVKRASLQKKSEFLNNILDIHTGKLHHYMIPLEKLLKVLLAFYRDGYIAFAKGSTVLKPNSPMYKDFSLNIVNIFTVDNMLKLYLLYTKADEEKKLGDMRFPIPYYMLGFIGSAFKGKTNEEFNRKLDDLFNSSESLMPIYNFYKQLTSAYADDYRQNKQVDYNVMIKQEINQGIFEKCYNLALGFVPNKEYISSFSNK